MVAFPYPCYKLLSGFYVTVQQLYKGLISTKNKKECIT